MKKLQNKKIFGALSVVAVLAIGGAVYLHQQHSKPAPTEQQQLQKQAAATPPNPKTDTDAAARAQQAQKEAANPTAKANIYISSLSQDDTNVYTSAIVEDQTSGTCTAHFTSGNNAFTRTAPIGLVSSYYACQGFTVAKSDFPAKGSWSVTVDFKNSTAAGSSDKQTLTLN